jgi:hypothetical protein
MNTFISYKSEAKGMNPDFSEHKLSFSQDLHCACTSNLFINMNREKMPRMHE